jgi:hypothetical protein
MNEEELEFVAENREKQVKYYTDGSFIFAKKEDELIRLAFFDDAYYRLRLWKGIPILEIDGLRMQLVKDFKTPLDYSRAVAKRLAVKPGDSVLDTCMGLGYTAIAAGKKAKEVTTCEYSDAVYALASWNPESRELFENGKFEILRGSIFEKIKEMEDDSFDAIVHDPPRFSKAGELYSLEFYKELLRVAKPGCRLFHYVGSVGKKSGRRIEEEAKRRLEESGFSNMRYEERLQGIFCKKPIR